MDNTNNNIDTFGATSTPPVNNINVDFLYIIIFYLIVSILGIGTILNIIYMSKWGQRIRIKYIKQSPILNFIANLLVYLSILGFPTIAIYIFTQLYYYRAIKLF